MISNLFKSLFKGAPSAFDPESACPECGSPLYTDAARPHSRDRCPNLDCPVQIRARIEHWASAEAMNIPELTPLLIVKLVAKGLVRDAAELYRLRIAEIAAVDGMTKESAKQLFDSLTASQSREAWRLLYGLSIPKLRPEDAQALCSRFSSVDNVFGASADRLMQAGVSQETAHSIVHWNTDGVNRRMVKRLFKARLNFKA